MPVLKLALEIDATAHPELHAILAGITNPHYQAERMRQLAVMGLLLERLRITPEGLRAAPAPSAVALPVVSPETGDAPAEAVPEPAVPASHLALVTPPAAPPHPRPDVHNFPVLHEEVPESLLRRRIDDESAHAVPTPSFDEARGGGRRSTDHDRGAGSSEFGALLDRHAADPSGAAETKAPPPQPVHPTEHVDTSPVVHMPGNRSRLMRMKNRGLFTNE